MLIAVDLDGTLLGRGGQVSARTAESLMAAKTAGHSIAAVTGRSWRTCVDRLKPATAIDYVVCCNGAYGVRYCGRKNTLEPSYRPDRLPRRDAENS